MLFTLLQRAKRTNEPTIQPLFFPPNNREPFSILLLYTFLYVCTAPQIYPCLLIHDPGELEGKKEGSIFNNNHTDCNWKEPLTHSAGQVNPEEHKGLCTNTIYVYNGTV